MNRIESNLPDLANLMSPEALTVMGQQLTGVTSHLESVFAAISQILALRDGGLKTEMEGKHTAALVKMMHHQLKGSPGSEHALSLCAILEVDNSSSHFPTVRDICSVLIRYHFLTHKISKGQIQLSLIY